MKRRRTIGVVVAIVAMLVGAAALIPRQSPANAPRFVRLSAAPAGPFTWEDYDWAGTIPFQGGKMWIMASGNGTNRGYLLYELEKRRVEGELKNAGALFFNEDLTKLFCEGMPSRVLSLKASLLGAVNGLLPGTFQVPTNRVDTFWILDMRSNRAERMGKVEQLPNYGSRWVPSPGFRYGYTEPTTSRRGSAFVLCDLEAATIKEVRFEGEIQGWWDAQNLLMRDGNGDFVALDVVSRQTAPVMKAESVDKSLADLGIALKSAAMGAVSAWNGREYDFYFYAGISSHYGPPTGAKNFLIKLDRKTMTLRLMTKEFFAGHLGFINEAGTHYTYSGESAPRNADGSVRVRELANGAERELVPGNNSGQYSLARMYKNSVIYRRNRLLWRVELNGTNATQLLEEQKRETR